MHSLSKVLDKLCQLYKSKVGDIVNYLGCTKNYHMLFLFGLGIIYKSFITIIIM